MITDLQLNSLVGIPFKDGGRDITGFDCWGLVKYFYKEFLNIELPEYAISAHDSFGIDRTFDRERKMWERSILPQDYALMAMRLDSENHPFRVNHVGIILPSREFIHCIEKKGVIISKGYDAFWIQRTESYYIWN